MRILVTQILVVLLLQVTAAAFGCAWLTAWIGSLRGCILNLAVFGVCVIDSILMTLTASAGLTLAGSILWMFTLYARKR